MRKTILFATQALMLFLLSLPASAELLDDIRLNKDSNGGVDAIVSFSVPIQYLRHFPRGKASSVSIFFNVLGNVPGEQWKNYETFRSPPSDIVTRFTITTRDQGTGPKVIIDFDRPAEFSISQGKDGQSIRIHIKADRTQKTSEPETKLPPAVVVTPVVAAPAVVVPPSVAVTPPNVAPVAKPVIAPAPADIPPPLAPVPPPATPTPPAEAPKPPPPQQIVVPSASASLGGKEGLPPFPRIDPYAKPLPGVVLPEPTTPEERLKRSNDQAAPLMIAGRDAMLSGQFFPAIEAFNKVLNLPPNKYSSDAQLWMGIARERSGQQLKARAEYELYLKLYPDAAYKEWVTAKLARLAPAPAPKKTATRPDPIRPAATEFNFSQYGSLSMYYFWGQSKTDTVSGTTNTPVTLSDIDQRSLISTINTTARAYNNQYDNRLVFQGLYSANLLPGQDNTDKVNSVYYELRARYDSYSVRFGRQSAMGGGVLGRFDGISGGYGFLPNWRINAAYGWLSEQTLGSKPWFYSGSLDFGLNDPFGGSMYYISQKTDGLIDRRATGGYFRYFEQGMTGMASLDYDLQFKEVNIFSLQGTLNQDNGMDYNFLLDRRRAPSWSVRNALIGTTATIEMLQRDGWTMDDIRALAKQRTAISNMAQFGMTQRLNDKWQFGTDLTLSNISGLPVSGTPSGVEGYISGTPATGTYVTLSERASGTNVLTENDLTTISLSLSKSGTVTGLTGLLNSRIFQGEIWTWDPTVQLSWQKDSNEIQASKQYSVTPLLRASYRWRSDFTLEGEGGASWSKVNTEGMQPSTTLRKYFSFGARWDF